MNVKRLLHNKVFTNASWIIVCKVIQSVLSLVISMLTARYLGPSFFGLINYAGGIVSFLAPIMELGFTGILVQELIDHPEEEGRIMGSSMLLSLASSLLCILGAVGFCAVANAGETLTLWVCALYSLCLIFRALELFRYWFQAKYLSKDTSLVSLVAYAAVFVYRVILIFTGRDVQWFAVSFAFDSALIALMLFILYIRRGGQRLAFSGTVARRMLRSGVYYILSGLMVAVFAETDKIMLKLMVDDAACGYYSAATTCAAMAGFVFQAIVDAFRPYIFESLRKSRAWFELNVKRLYSIIIYACLLESVCMALLSRFVILILYGEAYMAAVPMLRVSVWYITFSFLGVVRNIWLLAEGKQKYLWIINLGGALANILLNLCLIPLWGGIGAAAASVITQVFTNVLVGWIIPSIRDNNRLMMAALHPKYLIGMLRGSGGDLPSDEEHAGDAPRD